MALRMNSIWKACISPVSSRIETVIAAKDVSAPIIQAIALRGLALGVMRREPGKPSTKRPAPCHADAVAASGMDLPLRQGSPARFSLPEASVQPGDGEARSEEHTSELQSIMR